MKRTRVIWTADAEEVLIALWEHNLEDLRGPRKNSHIYQEMVAEMRAQGYDVDTNLVKNKMDNLTAKYRKIKNSIGTTGGSPSSWPLYEQVHRIIGGLTINNLHLIVEESFQDQTSSSESHSSQLLLSSPQLLPSSAPLSPPSLLSSPSPSPLSPSPPLPPSARSPSVPSSSSSKGASSEKSIKRRQIERLVTVCEDMKDSFSEGMEKFSKANDELIELEKAKVITMQEMQEDTKRLTDGVLDFLKHH